MRLWLLPLIWCLTACNGPGGPAAPPATDDDDDDDNNPVPIVRTAAIRLVEGAATVPAGTSVVVAEDFNIEGVERLEWDFDFDGTTFTPDRTLAAPTIPGPPVRLTLRDAGSRTLALRGYYPGDLVSGIGTLTLTVTPPGDPARFQPESQDVGELLYDAPVFRGAYTNVQGRGGHGIAVNGDAVAVAYWAIRDQQPGYFATASPDRGTTWSAPVRLLAGADDAPTINREPQIALTPAGDGFLAIWLGTGDASLRWTSMQIAATPIALTTAPIGDVPLPSGTSFATAPYVVTDPTDSHAGRVLVGVRGPAGEGLALVPWSVSGGALSFAPPVGRPMTHLPVRMTGDWRGETQLIAMEGRRVTLGGGSGGTTSVTVAVHLAAIRPDTTITTTLLIEKSGAPQRVAGYEASLAATSARFLLGMIEEAQPPFIEGGLSVFGGTYDATGATVDAFYPAFTSREDIANLAAIATPDDFLLLYTLPRLDVDPALNTNRSEELFAARYPHLQGAALSFDEAVNRGDPDGNEGLEQPALAIDGAGTIHAMWIESTWNRKALGRVGYNRTG